MRNTLLTELGNFFINFYKYNSPTGFAKITNQDALTFALKPVGLAYL